MSSSLQSSRFKDKENEVLITKDHPRTPIKLTKQPQKKFKTPPLNPTTRIPLGGKNVNENQRLHQVSNKSLKDAPKVQPSLKFGRRTPLKRKTNILNELAPNIQKSLLNSLLSKLNKVNEFADSDSKLDEFLKHEKGDDIDIEIVPKAMEPLLDEPDDSISFKEIDLAKIYKSPFHVPEFDENDKELEKLLEFDDSEVKQSSSKKRFMLSTTASASKKASTTPVMSNRLSQRLFKDEHTPKKARNLLEELIFDDDENNNKNNDDDDDKIANVSDLVFEGLQVDDSELRSLF